MSNVYKVIAITGLTLPANMPVKLSTKQLARRSHQVKPGKAEGFYVSAERLTFKMGEQVEVEGELPKNLAALTDKPTEASKPTLVKVDPGVPAKPAAGVLASLKKKLV